APAGWPQRPTPWSRCCARDRARRSASGARTRRRWPPGPACGSARRRLTMLRKVGRSERAGAPVAAGAAERWTAVRRAVAHAATGVRLRARARRFLRDAEIHPRDDLVELGSRGYGFWVVPAGLLGPDSRCYLAGVGEDITFDVALIARFGCTVHAFDPVPAARAYAEAAARHEPRFVFHPVGLWSSDTTLPLHAPAVEGHVSHSVTDLHGTRKLGDERLDLLKISAEGAEYEILDGVAADDVDVRIICVEFAQPAPRGRAERAYGELRARGYDLVDAHVTAWTWKATFVRDRAQGAG